LRTETPTDPTSYKYYDLMPNFGEELQVIGREFEEPFLVAVVMTRMD
jgi:cyanate lyase